MSEMMVDLRVAEGVNPVQLHEMWLELFRRRREMAKASSELFQRWKNAEDAGEEAEACQLWRQYSEFQANGRVFSAWTDLVHAAWVFSTEGRRYSLVGDLAVTEQVAALDVVMK
jgi:hypothetical protein